MTFPRPAGDPQFTAPWMRWLLPNLTLPEGYPMRWEGHLLLMTEEFFRPELVHLLVLIPKGNWKTTWEAGLATLHLLTVSAPRIGAGAADKEQATELYDFIAHFAEAEPEIDERLIVRPSTKEIRLAKSPGRAALKIFASDDSRQGGKKQGKNLTLGLLDEEHAHENDNLRVDLTSGGFKRREAAKAAGDPLWHAIGKDVSITTAGHDPKGPLGLKRAQFLGDPEKGIPPIGTVQSGLRVLPDGTVETHPEGRLTICRSPSGGSVMLEWACHEDDDLDDVRVVKFANPASTVTVESLQDAKESPDLTPAQFKRYRANVWTEGYESWLPSRAWERLYDATVPTVVHRTWEGATTAEDATPMHWRFTCPECEAFERVDAARGDDDELTRPETPAVCEHEATHYQAEQFLWPRPAPEFEEFVRSLYPEGQAIVAGVDMARYRDTAAVVALGRNDAGAKVPRAIVWRSGGHDNPIRYDWPKTALRLLDEHFNLLAAACDSRWFDQAGEELDGEGIAVEEFSQSPERIGPADTELRKEILSDEGEFAHDGDPILSSQIRAGMLKDLGPNLIKVVRQEIADPPPIDACKALSMANATEKVADESEPMAAWG